ncbi:MAG: TetR/AcrR family transcriptional regulator [Coriobacteriales bacterium]|nr:TetR/AcrR family transcriptional regulator [Coriobacteriales bacterium]
MKRHPDSVNQTKADLEEAFWQLYVKMPFQKITVAQVSDLAGYNRGTFYLHYESLIEMLQSIEDALLAGMTDCVETCMKRLKKDASKLNCIAACKDVVLYYEKNKRFISVLLSDRGDPAFISQLKNALKPLWREYVISADSKLAEEEIDLLLEYTLAGTLYMISRWLSCPGKTSAFDLAHLVYDFSIKDVRQRSQAT